MTNKKDCKKVKHGKKLLKYSMKFIIILTVA